MIKDILLSQLLALISVSGSVKQIKLRDGDLVWRADDSIDCSNNSHHVSIKWKRSKYCGSENQYLCMTLQTMRKPYEWCEDKKKYYKPVLKAYYYEGDNCNSHTKFIYEIIGNEIEIIDDIGLVGNGGTYERKNLLNIDPYQVYYDKVNCLGRWSTRP